MKWILILFAHVGTLGTGNSNALTTATFQTQQACMDAGKAARTMATGTVKALEYVCVNDGGKP